MDLVADDLSALRLVASDPGAALCTIVSIEGSFSRRLGAQLAIGSDGRITGSLSDGCLERELANQARQLRASAPKVLRYGRGSPFMDFRLPCGAGLDILIDPCPDRTSAAEVLRQIDDRQASRLALPAIPGCTFPASRRYLPAPRLLAFGAGPELDWLAHLARAAGLHCEVFGPETGQALGRAPGDVKTDRWTAIALLFHDHEWEPPILHWALSGEAYFIGAMGGAPAREARMIALQQHGWDKADLARVRSPIGLIPHVRDAKILALSILADIVGAYDLLLGDML